MKIRKVIISYLKEHPQDKLSAAELATALQLSSSTDLKLVTKTLRDLSAEHLLHFTKQGKIELEEARALVEGVFHANANGFGFVTIDPEEPDVFIGKGKTAFALEGDAVKIELTRNANPLKNESAEGLVVEVVTHALHELVGTFVKFDSEEAAKSGAIGFVKSRNKKIPYHLYLTNVGLQPADKDVVRAEITAYPTAKQQELRGAATEIVGHQGEMGLDVLEILAGMGIQSEFPADVLAQAEAIPELVSQADLANRVDYRNEITFTIDGADSKDLDDAVHAKRLANGNFELGVHIADVSHYVTENSPLDREALERGTSVYVTDRVVPMLPERLSNGICSLNPRQTRLTQSCVMEITPQGKMVHYRISQSVIKTTERMTYDDVNLMLAGDAAALVKFDKIADSVKVMAELHQILEKMRHDRGAIDFDTVEAKIIVNEKGFPVAIQKRERGIAERMIESFMLAANETVAGDFAKRKLPFIYRIHEEPKADRLERFIEFAGTFGLQINGTAQHLNQRALQDFLRKVQGEPGEIVLSTMLLRSMQQARYSEQNAGHYGLAAENYTHFTSPIRRYPDLLVHRLIRVFAQPTAENIDKWQEKIPDIAQQTSNRERRAVDAEREVEKMKKAEYMEAHVGEELDGVVSSVTRFGLFVELENTIEGLVHISTLKGDYFSYQERMLALVGARSGKVFRIGQKIKIKVANADKFTGDVDFEYLPSEFDQIEKVSKHHDKPKSGRAKSVKFDRKEPKHKTSAVKFDKKKSPNSKPAKKKTNKNPYIISERTGKSLASKFDRTDSAHPKNLRAKSVKNKFPDGRKKAHKISNLGK